MVYPKISIITPSFQQGRYIEQTIQSLLNQQYPNLEYIIIDGGSTDETVEIITKYQRNITYWVSEPDKGQAHAINKGLEKTTGEIVNWLNSDDYLEPGALFNIAKLYQNYPKRNVFCGYTHCFWEETGKTSHTYRMGVKKDVTRTILNIEMNQPGTFYKTEIIKSLGGVNETLRYVFDNELWMRYLCRFGQQELVFINHLLAHFRQHGSSKSFGEGFTAFMDEQDTILWHLAKMSDIPNYILDCMPKHVSKYDTHLWDLSYMNRNYLEAWLAQKYLITLWNNGFKKEVAESLKTIFKNRTLDFNWRKLSVTLKALKYL